MKALVTGGAGLIGSHIVDQLLEKGYEVRILDNLEPSVHPAGKPPWVQADAEFMHGDLRNPDDVEKALLGVEIIFHHAVYCGAAPNLAKMADVNMTGTARIFDGIRRLHLNMRKIVTASTQAVYGEGKYVCRECGPFSGVQRPLAQLESGEWEMRCPACSAPSRSLPTPEDFPLQLGGIYSLSKHFEEQLTLNLGAEWQIPAVALRYGLTYGPRQSVFNHYSGICSMFSSRLLKGLPPEIYEDGCQTRDFTFAEDVAKANLLVAESDAANHQVFNVGSGESVPIMKFANLLGEAFGAKVEPRATGKFRPSDLRHLSSDTSRMSALGWRPGVPLAEGVRRYAEWILSMPQPIEYFSHADQTLKNTRAVSFSPQTSMPQPS